MATTKRHRLMLDCDICGEPVYLSRLRYLELLRRDERPRCRQNGCERLCGAKIPGTARGAEVLDVLDVPLRVVTWPRGKRGNTNGALAKLAVTHDQKWRWDSVGAVGAENEV